MLQAWPATIKKVTLALVLFCEFCKISKNAFLTEHLRWLHLWENYFLRCHGIIYWIFIFYVSIYFSKYFENHLQQLFSLFMFSYNKLFTGLKIFVEIVFSINVSLSSLPFFTLFKQGCCIIAEQCDRTICFYRLINI